jgi:hypothetical protein
MKTALRVVETAIGGKRHPKPAAKAKKRRKDPGAVRLGRKGGLIGGVVRASMLTPDQRSQIARAAAQARWGKK